ncbi:unnamed protein product [Dicrocoelium dendriticum]|nr:unnamed protein product [Dicrocoelium dendriticum]
MVSSYFLLQKSEPTPVNTVVKPSFKILISSFTYPSSICSNARIPVNTVRNLFLEITLYKHTSNLYIWSNAPILASTVENCFQRSIICKGT